MNILISNADNMPDTTTPHRPEPPAEQMLNELLKLKTPTNEQGPQQDQRLAAILKAAAVDLSEPLEAPPVCFEITDNDSDRRAVLGTYGNFTVHIGKAKSGKTFWLTMAVSFALRSIHRQQVEGKIMYNRVEGRNRIKLYDTEQGRYHVQRVAKRIMHLAGVDHTPELDVLCLRPYAPNDRLAAIEQDLYSSKNVGLVIIDGVRDLVFDINEPAQAVQAIGKLLKWSEELGVHIMVVLHQNKGDNNARGHIGTEAVNKAETVVEVSKDPENGIFTVTPVMCRDREFTPFAFTVDDTGLPGIVDNWTPPGRERKQVKGKKDASDVPDNIHIECLTHAFCHSSALSYSLAWKAIQDAFRAIGQPVGNSQAMKLLSFYQNEKKWIKTSGVPGRTTYSFNPPPH